MLTRLRIRNFNALEDADISLGQSVLLIGPNNSGKTSALQALTLWRSGLVESTARRLDGETHSEPWSSGFEFQHANSESLYCRPLRFGADTASPARTISGPPVASG